VNPTQSGIFLIYISAEVLPFKDYLRHQFQGIGIYQAPLTGEK
jgi:hypothetical protein